MKVQIERPDGAKLIIYSWWWSKKCDKLIAKFLRKEPKPKGNDNE